MDCHVRVLTSTTPVSGTTTSWNVLTCMGVQIIHYQGKIESFNANLWHHFVWLPLSCSFVEDVWGSEPGLHMCFINNIHLQNATKKRFFRFRSKSHLDLFWCNSAKFRRAFFPLTSISWGMPFNPAKQWENHEITFVVGALKLNLLADPTVKLCFGRTQSTSHK